MFADCFVNLVKNGSYKMNKKIKHCVTLLVWTTYEMLLAHLKEHHHGDRTCQPHRGVCPPQKTA